MDLKQTQVTDQNRERFYQQLYPQQLDSPQQLININMFSSDNVVVIDCCGWHYKNVFANKNIISIDPIKTALEFRLPKEKIYRLLDNRDHDNIVWPVLSATPCAVIFDRSPILKYRTVDQLKLLFNQVQQMYQPESMIIRLNLMFVDNSRLQDRFDEVSAIRVDNTVIQEFCYNANIDQLIMRFKKKINYDSAY
jgi:hypothetical protein